MTPIVYPFPWGRYYYLHKTDEKTEAQSPLTCLRTLSKKAVLPAHSTEVIRPLSALPHWAHFFLTTHLAEFKHLHSYFAVYPIKIYLLPFLRN